MDELKSSVTQLTGAVNNVLDQLRGMEGRIAQIEQRNPRQAIQSLSEQLRAVESRINTIEQAGPADIPPPQAEDPLPLRGPSSEQELKDISKLPDSVKELQVFDGNPVHYVSWIHSVETVLKDYEIVRSKPIYRAILQHIRQKVRGKADSALVSYNVFDNEWVEIKRVLSLHYADKRDIRTLEHQLNQLTQGGSRVDDFYATVNHQFSLILNKIRAETYSTETVDALVETYRNRALDVFVRGLNGDLSRLLIIQKPKTLPEAYSACLEMQNLNFRSNSVHTQAPNTISSPVYYNFRNDRRPPPSGNPTKPFNGRNNFSQRPRSAWNSGFQRQNPPQRPTGPKPAIKMEVDNSVQTKNVNYMNRPNNPFKREASSDSYPRKQQRFYHMEAITDQDPESPETVDTAAEGPSDENFMVGASFPAYHT